ncbi:hypothetical protein ENUP19_0122G0017 [Entamoeba nuttalli]|uniref:Rap-GAP domain-containing protein n=1 Tax=Entamoeba nuttalli TaxID=412467 RepID=A0ABQ0DJ39_9EUKA
MSSEVDKKIRKKQTQLFEPKESVNKRVRACISLSEKYMSPDDFDNFIKQNREIFTTLVIELFQNISSHLKKGKISVSYKDATIHLKIIRIMYRHYSLDELKNFDLYQKVFDNYLKIESHPELREACFNTLLDIILHYGVESTLTSTFIKSINIGQLYDNENDFPVNKLDFGENCYCTSHDQINQKEMTKKFIKIFIDLIKTPETFDKLYLLLEALLSFIYPHFADQANYKYKQEHQINFDGHSSEVELFVLEELKELYTSLVVDRLKKRPSFILFIKYYFNHVLQLEINETSSQVILSVIRYFSNLILLNPLVLEKEEQVLSLQTHIISSLSVIFDKPFSSSTVEVCMPLATQIKQEILIIAKSSLSDILKKTMKEMVLCCIDYLIKQEKTPIVSLYIDLLIILFVQWKFGSDQWKLLKDDLSKYYYNENVIYQIGIKIKHVVRIILKHFYSPLLLENTDDVIVGSKKVERSTHLETIEDIFVAPSFDESFKEYLPETDGDKALELWYNFYYLFEGIFNHSLNESYEHGLSLLYEIAITFIQSETKLFQFGILQANEKILKLVDIFGQIFFDSFERQNQTSKTTELLYRFICKLINRSYVRFNNEIYNLFYEKVIKGFEIIPIILMEELYDIVYNQIPGYPLLIPYFVQHLKSLSSDLLLPTSNPNRNYQIVLLLSSLISVNENYPSIVLDLSNVNKLSFEFNLKEELSECFKPLLEVFKSISCQISLIYSIAAHIIFSRKINPDFNIEKLLLMIIEKIEVENENIYRPACEVICELASFTKYFTINDIQFMIKRLIKTILNPQVKTEAIGCVFTALTEWVFSPSFIFFKALSPEITVDLLNAISFAMTLKQEKKTINPLNLYRASAPECAEIFIQTLLNAFAFVPSEKGNDKYLSSQIEGEGSTTWWAYGNNLLSIEERKDENFCRMIIRNAVGKSSWNVQSVSILDDIGIPNDTCVRKLSVKDIITSAPKEKIEEKPIDPHENKLRSLINQILDQEPDFLDWELPNNINKEEYCNELESLKDTFENIQQQIKGFNENKIEEETNKIITLERHEIDSTKLLIQMLLCSTQNIDVIGKSNTTLIPITPTDKFKTLVEGLDKSCVRSFHKIGLIYVKNGQYDQFDILKNQEGSPAYKEFVEGLGWTIDIETHSGFVGGLDKTYLSTGKNIRYFADATKEVIFHDITLMPTVLNDDQQIIKKRHVGNDYVHIIWNEADTYSPKTISSQFNAAHIVIKPIGNGLHKIRIWRKQNIRQFGPLIDGMIVGKEVLPNLVRETAINASYCCSLNISPDDYLKPYLRRTTLIQDIIDKNKGSSKTNFYSTLSIITNPQTVTELTDKK